MRVTNEKEEAVIKLESKDREQKILRRSLIKLQTANAAEETNEKLEQEVSSAHQELDEYKSQAEEAVADLQAELQVTQKHRAESDAVNEILEQEVSSAHQELDEYKSQAEEAIADLQTELQATQKHPLGTEELAIRSVALEESDGLQQGSRGQEASSEELLMGDEAL